MRSRSDSTALFSVSLLPWHSTACLFSGSPLLIAKCLFFIGLLLFLFTLMTSHFFSSLEALEDAVSPLNVFPLDPTFIALPFGRMCSILFLDFGEKRNSSDTFSSPSLIGRKHKRSSVILFVSRSDCWSSLLLFDEEALVFFSFEASADKAISGSSSSRDRVRMEEVTSHQIVDRLSRIKQILHVGASGLGLPPFVVSLVDEESSRDGSLPPDSLYPLSSEAFSALFLFCLLSSTPARSESLDSDDALSSIVSSLASFFEEFASSLECCFSN
mmetsp:Transcript_27898/g.42770  ORF Transcript_27898/g.42770 Transcript_27898/m.42770 type:complete len:272 (-) Transcript_27898:313-1128(-)